MSAIKVDSQAKRQVIDITDKVQSLVYDDGLATVFVQHTTAGVTIADMDPGTELDLLDFLDSLIPAINWRHPHDPSHAPDHLLASLLGPSVSIPYQAGVLSLGAWQRVILVEFDGPRQRNIVVHTGGADADE